MDRATSTRVNSGVLSPHFLETSSVDDALTAAKQGNAIAWIGVADPATEDLARLGSAIGVDDQELAEICGRGSVSDGDRDEGDQPTRARISLHAGVAHLVLLGTTTSSSGVSTLGGELEVLATRAVVVVITRGLAATSQPAAIQKAIDSELSLMNTPSSGNVVGLLVSLAIDWYADLIDDIERALSEIADELFSERRPDTLPRLYELAKPLHGATIAIQPIAHHLDRILLDLGADIELNESRGWLLEAEHLANRSARLQAFFLATLQIYVGLVQEEANELSDKRNEITQKMSAVALLLAIPTIIFSIYGTNFKDIPLLKENWGYAAIMTFTVLLCGYVYFRLRRSGWL
jgi:magnesium transporter